MPERAVVVSLSVAGCEASEREGVFTEFAAPERVMRSGIVLLIAIGLAVMFLPIPIIHLLAIPMILIGGLVLAIRQLSISGRLAPMRIPCPRCGASNRVGGGLGVRSLASTDRSCENCRRILMLRVTPFP